MKTPTASTRLLALLGDPVAHSLSPRFQNAAFQAAGVDGVYVALRCDADSFAGLLVGIARSGGGGNVTLPHKERAASLVESATEAVRRTGACNTYWYESGRLCGDNTDVPGFQIAVQALVGSLAGARVLLVGAGGAARGALYALLLSGVDSVVLLNRSPDRAEALRQAFESDARRILLASEIGPLGSQHFDLVVNATSLGLHSTDPLPLEFGRIGGAGAVFDLVYARGGTRWVREARALGIPAMDGLEMLIHQGAVAFERWWGVAAPVEAMRAALADVAPAEPVGGGHGVGERRG
ncbi:MAG TPA: shikimate dehydrogenase [Longimicrobiales bacterium]